MFPIKIGLNKMLIIGDGSVKDGWPSTQIYLKKFKYWKPTLPGASGCHPNEKSQAFLRKSN